MSFTTRAWLLAAAALAVVCAAVRAEGQTLPGLGATTSQPPAAARPDTEADPLGRTTPRGTVYGFLGAARRGDNELARQYLNTRLTGDAAEDLAHQLFMVLDARLPPTLTELSDLPEGSRVNPLEPDRQPVGTIAGPDGPVDISLERVTRRGAPVWLFSARTLDTIGPVYEDILRRRARIAVPRFLVESRVGSIRMFEWIAILLAITVLYLLTVVLNGLLTRVVAPVLRRLFHLAQGAGGDILPLPARLLIITIVSRWIFTRLPVSLLVRQSLANLAAIVVIISVAWLLVLFNGVVERRITRRIPVANLSATLSLLRVARRAGDVLVIFAAAIAILRHYGVNPTPILAGLGVGGIAVALAAQKTLENVIAGASLIFDQALRVGDAVRVGTFEGTVEHIGLRSTRIRTVDRTLVSLPNGLIANMSLETLSARDKFWFHPTIQLRYETTAAQLRDVVDGIRTMLEGEASVNREPLRVRFLRLGAFSIDIEVFAYVSARDWPHFLELQEQLLSRIMEIVAGAGAEIAFPSQTMYVERKPVAESA